MAVSMGYESKAKRELSAQLERAFRQYLRAGGSVYRAGVGETGLDVVALQSPKGKARTHNGYINKTLRAMHKRRTGYVATESRV